MALSVFNNLFNKKKLIQSDSSSHLRAELATLEQTAANQFDTARQNYEAEIKRLKDESIQIGSELDRLTSQTKAQSGTESSQILEKYEREEEEQRNLALSISKNLRSQYIYWGVEHDEITRGTEVKPLLRVGAIEAESVSKAPLDALAPFIGSRNLWIRGQSTQAWPLKVARSAVFGAYVSVQPGQMLVTVYDPSMIGDLSLFYEMSDDNRELYREISRTPEAFEETLDFHLQRLEDVNRAMKGKFESLTEMVSETGQQEFPYRLLVVMEDWYNLDERTRGKLTKLMESGPKYGIHVVLMSVNAQLTEAALKSSIEFTYWKGRTQEISIEGTRFTGDNAIPVTFDAPSDEAVVALSKLVAIEAKQGALPEIPLGTNASEL